MLSRNRNNRNVFFLYIKIIFYYFIRFTLIKKEKIDVIYFKKKLLKINPSNTYDIYLSNK